VVTPAVRVELNEEVLLAVLLGNLLEVLRDRLSNVGLVVRNENPDKRQVALSVLSVVLRADLTDGRELLNSEDLLDSIDIVALLGGNELTITVDLGLGSLSVCDNSKVSIIAALSSDLLEGLSISLGSSGEDDLHGVLASLALTKELLDTGLLNLNEGREAVLVDEADKGISLTSILIGVLGLVALDQVESGVATNAVFAAKSRLLSAVNLSEILAVDALSSLFEFRGKSLAVSAPGCIELDKGEVMGGNVAVEVFRGKFLNGACRGDYQGVSRGRTVSTQLSWKQGKHLIVSRRIEW